MQRCPQLPVLGDGGGDGPGLLGLCAQPGEEHTAPDAAGTRQAAAQAPVRHGNGMTHRSRRSRWESGQTSALVDARCCLD